MASTLCCTLNELHTFSTEPKQFFRAGFVLKIRNLGICQLGFSQNGGSKSKLLSTCVRKCFPLRPTEGLVSVDEEEGKGEEEEKDEEGKGKGKKEEERKKDVSFTISYLIRSCGLSRKYATFASERVNFSTSYKPNLVLGILRKYRFKRNQIGLLVLKDPSLLILDNPKITLIPIIEYFRSMGFTYYKIGSICSSFPKVFRLSLKNQIIPVCDFLRSVLLVDEKVRSLFTEMGGPELLAYDMQLRLAPNVNTLLQKGATSNVIWYTLTKYPSVINRNSDAFVAGVEEVIRLGFNPSRLTFVTALFVTIAMSKETREKKLKAYKRWGLSDEDIAFAFSRHPICMLVSEEKIMEVMDLLLNEFGLKLTDIKRNAGILTYSLKARLIPRFSVIRVLKMKGFLKKGVSYSGSIQLTQNQFLKKYVAEYKKQVPQLLDVYRGKVGLRELGFAPDETQRISPTP